MYLLETVSPSIIDNLISTLLGGGILMGVAIFFYNKNEKNKEDRLIRVEQDAAKANKRSYEIEKNYIKRFEEVNEKIDETKDVIIEKIERLNNDKVLWRMQHTKDIAAIQGDVRHIMDALNRKP